MKALIKVILYCGWFLMVPPKDKAPETVPLSKWIHTGSYDTALECENAKAGLWKEFKGKLNTAQADALTSSRCIPPEFIK